MRVAVSGSSGLIGTALTEALRSRGDEVLPLVRRDPEAGERRWWPEQGRIADQGLADVDAVVNLAGTGIASRPWTSGRRADILDSRVQATRTLAGALASAPRCTRFVSGSAVGYYGNTGEQLIDETAPRGEGFLPKVAGEWEAAAANETARTAFLRTGLVLAGDGGLLAPQLPLFKLGLGGPAGNGRQWMPWISIDDHVAATLHLLDNDVEGPVNLCGPNPVRNAEFTKALGAVLHRPTVLPVPLPLLRIALTSEAVDELLLVSNRIRPAVLEQSGFVFGDTDIQATMARLLGGSKA